MTMLPGPLVSARWLSENLSRVRVVDVRWSIPTGPKQGAYEAGHIPGAVFADLDRHLSDPPGERGRHPLPSPERFAETRCELGMDLPVVAYDDRGGPVAARLWWMLDSLGAQVSVLDGGIDAWDGPLTSGREHAPRASFSPAAWPGDRFVGVQDVLPSIDAGSLLVDARSAERFAGEPNPIDSRPGHIPGSVSRPWEENLDASGRFLDPQSLKRDLAALGVKQDTPLIGSCGSGVTGCHNLLAARVAGLGRGRLYAGSWSEWSQDPGRPLAKRPAEG